MNNDCSVRLNLDQLSKISPFVLVVDEGLTITWASEPVVRRLPNVLELKVPDVLDTHKTAKEFSNYLFTGNMEKYNPMALKCGDLSIPLMGKWFKMHTGYALLANPNITCPDDLEKFDLGDFSENTPAVTLLALRDEIVQSMRDTKASLNKLQKQEAKFRNLYESSGDAVMLLDEKGFFDCNGATLKLFGYSTREEFCDKDPSEVSPLKQPCGTDSSELAREYISTAMKDGSKRFDWIHQKSDGTQFPCEVLLNSLELQGRTVLQAVVRDISERKEHEARIIREEKNLRTLIDSVQVGIMLIDPETSQIVRCNKGALDIFEMKEEDVIGTECYNYVCEKEEGICPIVDRQLSIENIERQITSAKGRQVSVLKSAKYVEINGQQLLLEALTDISDLKAAQAEVNKLSFAIEQSANVIIITDTKGIIQYVNPKFERLTGYSTDEVIGRKPSIVKSGDTPAAIYKELWETISSGKPWSGELRDKRKDGELYWVKVSITPIVDESGFITNYLAIKEDITEQKRLESERRALEKEMNQARKLEAVGSLAAGIAHEINTPIQFVGDNTRFMSDSFNSLIALIDAYSNLWQKAKNETDISELDSERITAEEDADLDYLKGEIPTAIDQTLDGVKRVSKIIMAMKDLAHNDQGEKSESNINDMIASCITVSHNQFKFVADIETDFFTELPNIECYRDDLNQVFLNLIINAAHAIEGVVGDASSGKGTIKVATLIENNELVIKISDTGTGIPEEIRDRIFDPFFSTKDVGKGTGQGLSIARKIVVDKHKGSLSFDTAMGEGTTFIIRLPMIVPELVEA